MKLYTCFVVLLLITVTLTLNAQVPYYSNYPLSFRSLSLGGIINDDLDLVYDPIELRFVDSLRLYTNLSNLTSYDEEVLGTYGDHEFLLGVSRKNPWMDNHWMSALVRFEKYKYITESSQDYITLSDYLFPYNDVYDYRQTQSYKSKYGNPHDYYSFLLNNSFLFTDITFGLKLEYTKDITDYYQAATSYGTGTYPFSNVYSGYSSFDRSYEAFYLDSNYAPLKWSEHGNFLTTYENPYFRAIASAMKPMWGYELRGDLIFHTIDASQKINDLYSASYEYFRPYISNYSSKYSETDGYQADWKRKGSGFGIGAAIRRTFDQQPQRRNDGYYSLGVGLDFSSYDYTDQGTQPRTIYSKYFDGIGTGGSDYVNSFTEDYSGKNNGDGTATNLVVNAKFNIPLVDGVYFGLGGSYMYYTEELKTKYAMSFKQVTNNSLTDNVNNASDYIHTITYSENADRTEDVTVNRFMVPVGIEYKFTENKRWSARVGTIFAYEGYESNAKKTVTDSKAYTSKWEYGDGTSSTSIDNDYYYNTKSNYKYSSTWKEFTYGLGYEPTENLQIDLMGFFDLSDSVQFFDMEFFKSLRFSFVMKF